MAFEDRWFLLVPYSQAFKDELSGESCRAGYPRGYPRGICKFAQYMDLEGDVWFGVFYV